jgi:hypothetical protein
MKREEFEVIPESGNVYRDPRRRTPILSNSKHS